MIRDSILDTELAEPAIGEVHLHFTADQSLRADRKDIPHDQHPDHQFRIDRRATHGRIMRCKFAAKPGQIESSVDLPHQMIFGNRVAKMKLVEQLTLVTLQTAHHGSTSPRIASTQRNHASRPVSTDFCNKICQQATSITDGGSVSGDRKLKESTLRFARDRPQPSAVGFDDRAADR